MKVIIRADGNKEIAMGHIMRCLAIGEALRKAGAEVVFATAGEETRELIAKKGFSHYVLGTSYREMESEIPVLRECIRQVRPDVILADSYFVTERYMKELGTFAKTVYLDDMGKISYPVSMLINYNIYGKNLPYETWYREAGAELPKKCLLGCQYAPLREEFQKGLKSRSQGEIRDVLLTTGGGDLVNAAGGICRHLAEEQKKGYHKGVRFRIVCGPFSEYKKELYELAEENPAFIVHENVAHMSELMAVSDAAVSAAGSTMYELCSMQLPAVCFYFAENQRQMAECFADQTEIKNAGNITAERETVLERICEGLRMLEESPALCSRIRRQMGELTDGRGAERIASSMLDL